LQSSLYNIISICIQKTKIVLITTNMKQTLFMTLFVILTSLAQAQVKSHVVKFLKIIYT
jgi:hypothetical protein